MKGNYRKVNRMNLNPPNPKPGIDYDKPIGPEKPTAQERFASDHPWLAGAAAKVSERSRDVASDLTRPNSFRGAVSPATPMPSPDPFGVRRTGNPFGMGISFPQSPAPRSSAPKPSGSRGSTRTIYKANGDVEVIRSGSSKSIKRKQSREPQGTNIFADPFHIPKHMKHLF